MTTAKNTRRALISGVLVILMCVAMLIGTTFAWFTDSASTSVNTIKSGKLDVQLVDKNGAELTGTELTWKTADSRATPIYWEPGCTYVNECIQGKETASDRRGAGQKAAEAP